MIRRLALCLCLLSLPASADLIPDAESACRDEPAGTACRAEFGPGVCTAAKCSRKDYSGGFPPKSKQVDCLRCLPVEASGSPAPALDAGAPPQRLKKKRSTL